VTSSGAQELSRNNAQKCLKVGDECSASSILVCTPPLLSRSGGGGRGGDASGTAAAALASWAAGRGQIGIFLSRGITFCWTTHHPPRFGTALTLQAPATPPLEPPPSTAARCAARTYFLFTRSCTPKSKPKTKIQAAGGAGAIPLPTGQSQVPASLREPSDLGLNFRARSAAAPLHSRKHQLSLSSLQICRAPVFDPPLLQCSALSPSVFLFLAGPQRALQFAHRNQPQSITHPLRINYNFAYLRRANRARFAYVLIF
jgi:hypothetical protein